MRGVSHARRLAALTCSSMHTPGARAAKSAAHAERLPLWRGTPMMRAATRNTLASTTVPVLWCVPTRMLAFHAPGTTRAGGAGAVASMDAAAGAPAGRGERTRSTRDRAERTKFLADAADATACNRAARNSMFLRRSLKLATGIASAAFVATRTFALCDEKDVFKSRGDPYDGVSVSSASVAACESQAAFEARLDRSLDEWKRGGRRGVWIQIPASRPELIAAVLGRGFGFHHAEPSYLMVNKWLPGGESPLPANASHSVGVGVICVNSDDQILVVQEASGPAALRQSKTGTAFWKLPTGLVNQGEDLCAAAVRETREETGIDVDFVQLASIRDGHKALHGKDNLFCVCIVKPRTSKIRVQTSELADARWMPVDEFLALPYYAPATAYGELNRAAIDCLRGRRGGLSGHSLPEKFRPGETRIYVGQPSGDGPSCASRL